MWNESIESCSILPELVRNFSSKYGKLFSIENKFTNFNIKCMQNADVYCLRKSSDLSKYHQYFRCLCLYLKKPGWSTYLIAGFHFFKFILVIWASHWYRNIQINYGPTKKEIREKNSDDWKKGSFTNQIPVNKWYTI